MTDPTIVPHPIYRNVIMHGSPEDVQQLLDELPGDHRADHRGGNRYCIASSDPAFLEFVLPRQGYGEVIQDELTGASDDC